MSYISIIERNTKTSMLKGEHAITKEKQEVIQPHQEGNETNE